MLFASALVSLGPRPLSLCVCCCLCVCLFVLATQGANRFFAAAILFLGFLTGATPGDVQIFIQRLRPITYARPDMMHVLRRLWTKLPQGPAWSLPALLSHNAWRDRLQRL